MVEQGLLNKVLASDSSTCQNYELTDKGRELRLVLVALRQSGEAHLYKPGEERFSRVDKQTGQPVALLQVRSQDGHVLGADDVEVRTPPHSGVRLRNRRNGIDVAAPTGSNRHSRFPTR